MKKLILFIIILGFCSNLFSFEVYKKNIYPRVQNHITTSYGYGIFRFNVMENRNNKVTIERRTESNNSTSLFEYTYDSEGFLSTYIEQFKMANNEYRLESSYTFTHENGILKSVQEKGRDIYFPNGNSQNQYFSLRINQRSVDYTFQFSYDEEDQLTSIKQDDQNGTTYFFRDDLLRKLESAGSLDQRISARYEYNAENNLSRYFLQSSEGRGTSLITFEYEFKYDENGNISKYLFVKGGKGQDFSRVLCNFDHILDENGRILSSTAFDENAQKVRTATFEYENDKNFVLTIYDGRTRLIATYNVSVE